MLIFLQQRIILEGRYILENNSTIRKTAKAFDVSKSCVHKDIHQKLKIIDEALYLQVKKVLNNNFKEKHLRGGIATKNKFKRIKECKIKNLQNI